MGGANISTKWLAVFAFAIIVVIIYLVFLRHNLTTGANKAQEEKCRSSIQLHSQFVKASGERGAPSIACTANEVTVNNANEEKAKQTIANQLVFCWDRWQHGDVELFKEEGAYCNPCSILTFTDPDKPISGLGEYLHTARKPGGGTYEEYLFPKKTDDYAQQTAPQSTVAIDTSKQYAVVFYYDKNHSMKRYLEMVEKDPGAAARVVEDAVPTTAIMSGIGAVGGAIAVCAAVTAGACALIATPVAAVGAVVVGGATLTWKTLQKHPYPEWYSRIVLVPNNGTAYRALGCGDVFQEGPPPIVAGAENLQ